MPMPGRNRRFGLKNGKIGRFVNVLIVNVLWFPQSVEACFRMKNKLLFVANKACLLQKQGLFFHKNEWFWHANKPHFALKVPLMVLLTMLFRGKNMKKAMPEELECKWRMSKKNTGMRLFLTFKKRRLMC